MSEEIQCYHSFDKMDLKETILRGIYGYGFEKPSVIQSKAIVPIIKGGDIIAQAQSGTGKTATFSIGVLQQIDESIPNCQALIMAPTRELSNQIHRVITSISDYMNITCHISIGGKSIGEDVKALRNSCHIIVGTPGRIYDLLERGILQSEHIKSVVLDEADEMLSIGFKEQIRLIFECMPSSCQIILFSATMKQEMITLTETFLRSPTRIFVKRDEITLEGIKQYYVNVEREDWKITTLFDLYEQININQAIIFCNTRKTVEWLSEQMNEKGFCVLPFHSELDQYQREDVMRKFRLGTARVLISTDILGRGIDVQQVSMVFNYDLPVKIDNYIHRIGRSGRFGRKGVAINFITNDSISIMQEIQNYYSTQINELPIDIASIE
jgi:translation initiation factor 4A